MNRLTRSHLAVTLRGFQRWGLKPPPGEIPSLSVITGMIRDTAQKTFSQKQPTCHCKDSRFEGFDDNIEKNLLNSGVSDKPIKLVWLVDWAVRMANSQSTLLSAGSSDLRR